MMSEAEQMTADALDRWTYQARVRAVLDHDAPACGLRGRNHATCVRLPNHGGALCEGPGFDDWGPKYVAWKNRRKART